MAMATVVFFVVRVGHGIEEHLEARQAADILGRAAPFPVDEARIFDVGFAGTDRLHGDGVPPVVAHIRARLPQNTAYIRALV
jgi:hypothetical protein